MDAEVVSVGILREGLLGGAITMNEVEVQISPGTTHLLQESTRMKEITSNNETWMMKLPAHCERRSQHYHITDVILEITVRLDSMRHLEHFPKFHQQKVSLEALKIYAPIAHAVGDAPLSLELEDLSFQQLFPSSYSYFDTQLSNHEVDTKPLIGIFKDQLLRALKSASVLEEIVNAGSAKGHIKSRFSTMKKVLEDGCKPEEVHDILGTMVILDPKLDDMSTKIGNQACYRTLERVHGFWKEVPKRRKDYIANSKGEYESLHAIIDIRDHGAVRLIWIRV